MTSREALTLRHTPTRTPTYFVVGCWWMLAVCCTGSSHGVKLCQAMSRSLTRESHCPEVGEALTLKNSRLGLGGTGLSEVAQNERASIAFIAQVTEGIHTSHQIQQQKLHKSESNVANHGRGQKSTKCSIQNSECSLHSQDLVELLWQFLIISSRVVHRLSGSGLPYSAGISDGLFSANMFSA